MRAQVRRACQKMALYFSFLLKQSHKHVVSFPPDACMYLALNPFILRLQAAFCGRAGSPDHGRDEWLAAVARQRPQQLPGNGGQGPLQVRGECVLFWSPLGPCLILVLLYLSISPHAHTCSYSLTLKDRLNAYFGVQHGLIVGKHSDVPGMSKSAIPTLAAHGKGGKEREREKRGNRGNNGQFVASVLSLFSFLSFFTISSLSLFLFFSLSFSFSLSLILSPFLSPLH